MADAASNIEMIPLNLLVPSRDNVRRTNSQAGQTELAASILAHGLIQNLHVTKAPKGKFEVTAGARRLGALRALANEGKIASDWLVPCKVRNDQAEASDTEISLAENMMRERMNVVDELEAFRKLRDGGMTPEAIGDRFGLSHVTVRRRLKLAALSTRILEILREGEMSLGQAEALALADDHAAQEKVWFEASQAWQRDPRNLREALSKEHMRGSHRLARFVTLDAYREAGGEVITDLFSEARDCYLSNRQLVVKLATEKLTAASCQFLTAGWGWAEPDLEGNAHHGGAFERIYPVTREASENETAELAQLDAEYDKLAELLESQGGTDDELEAASNRLDAIEQRREDIEDGLRSYDPAETAIAGCLVSVSHHGELSVMQGVVRKEDWPMILALRGVEAQPASAALAEGGALVEMDNDAGTLPTILIEELTAIRTAALRVEMTRNPAIAIAAVLHPLLMRGFFSGTLGFPIMQSGVEIRGEFRTLEGAVQSPASHKAIVAWTDHVTTTKAKFPRDPRLLWEWLIEQDMQSLVDLLATVSAANTNAIRYRHDTRRDGRIEQADEIARAVDLDMARWWRPDGAFFERMTKKAMGNVMRAQGIAEDRISSMQKLPKYEAAYRTEAEIAGTGYMPNCLVTSSIATEGGDVDDGASGMEREVEPCAIAAE